MARGVDERKLREWAERLERRRASGLTVSRFCAREGVSVNTFYYWSKQVGSAAAARRGEPASEAGVPAPVARRGVGRGVESLSAVETLVRFRWGCGVTVEVPAQALDVIRCLAESAARDGAAPDGAPRSRAEAGGAFHEFVLGARR